MFKSKNSLYEKLVSRRSISTYTPSPLSLFVLKYFLKKEAFSIFHSNSSETGRLP